MIKKIAYILILLIVLHPTASSLAEEKNSKLANYFLHWSITESEARELAKWDLLVLDMEVQENSRAELRLIRQLNPRVKILAYVPSQNLTDPSFNADEAVLRKKINNDVGANWWLRDRAGNRLSDWHDTYTINITDYCGQNSTGLKFNDYLPQFVAKEIISTGLWDGVFFDNIWNGISWFNNSNVSVQSNGLSLNATQADSAWRLGVIKILKNTRALIGEKYLILGNGSSSKDYQKYFSGWMLENFPTPWESNGTWSSSMNFYSDLEKSNLNFNIVNGNASNLNNFAKFRFDYASALLGNSYFSFDYGPQDHAQFWWFDEYDVNLGKKVSSAYNLLDKNNKNFKPGLWRADFTNALVVVNSTDKEQRYSFPKEEFEKINGQQDSQVNNGKKVNWVNLAPQDALVLLKRSSVISNSLFSNGNFFRVFNFEGRQLRNGFFAYFDNFAGNQNLLVHDFAGDSSSEITAANKGMLDVWSGEKKITSFRPYGTFAGNFAISYLDNRIVTAAGKGGGPQISVFNNQGQVQYRFFAYDDKFRGGVNLASGDVDGDGVGEIVTAPISGGGPQVKVFKANGQLKYSFFAYDKNFRGGVSVAVSDVDGDGQAEIITGPGSGIAPEVRIFDQKGNLKYNFLAYDATYKQGISVAADGLNKDNLVEILVGIASF